ncbi:hypothetical protein LAZ40_04730 [Cereibacter sphaeroides]|uniref:hypothetical protein n=1 Tax=Cereibacter sphaeroides TaxID=1063 RepID=UPI001F347B3D|nr:hypothetical protein [Cereibacter sphaeroides]MCE6958361.1 hypothetical protein [Cereibacter sphaeroides]MCE6972228.1 hypothetical protein [Cereibacter sphaeroides]
MQEATIRISEYISAHGAVVSENHLSGTITIREGERLLTGRPIAFRDTSRPI